MANPQPDKYIKISTELFEALCRIKINGEARQMFDFIMRKTWGYNKKKDHISTQQVIEGTGLVRRAVERARQNLRSWNMISTDKIDGTYTLTYSIQKDYEKWQVPTKLTVPTKPVKSTDKTGSKVPTKLTVPYNTIDNTINKQKTGGCFTPPTVEEVKNYCSEKKLYLDPEAFIDFYASKGWMVGRNRMKDWKAAARNWARRDAAKRQALKIPDKSSTLRHPEGSPEYVEPSQEDQKKLRGMMSSTVKALSLED